MRISVSQEIGICLNLHTWSEQQLKRFKIHPLLETRLDEQPYLSFHHTQDGKGGKTNLQISMLRKLQQPVTASTSISCLDNRQLLYKPLSNVIMSIL